MSQKSRQKQIWRETEEEDIALFLLTSHYANICFNSRRDSQALNFNSECIFDQRNRKLSSEAECDQVKEIISSNSDVAPVWPNLAKFRHFGQIFKVLGNFSRV